MQSEAFILIAHDIKIDSIEKNTFGHGLVEVILPNYDTMEKWKNINMVTINKY